MEFGLYIARRWVGCTPELEIVRGNPAADAVAITRRLTVVDGPSGSHVDHRVLFKAERWDQPHWKYFFSLLTGVQLLVPNDDHCVGFYDSLLPYIDVEHDPSSISLEHRQYYHKYGRKDLTEKVLQELGETA